MKAILRVSPGEVAVVDRPMPEPGPGEVRLKVTACGLCGSDVARYRAEDERWNSVVLGHECCGLVDALGPGVEQLRAGQNVALLPLAPDFTCPHCLAGHYALCPNYTFYGSRLDGGFAEYMVAPERCCLPLPADLDPEAGAMLEPLSVAAEACLLAGGVAGQSVLVMGAGAIGLLAVELALAMGARQVLACDVVPAKLARAEALGALPVPGGPDAVAQIVELTGGGADICLECSGHHAAVSQAVDALAPAGRLVLVGTGPGDVVLTGAQREQISRRMLTIRGQWMSYGAPWPGRPWTQPLALLREGRLHPQQLITQRYTFDEAPEAIRFVLAPGAEYLKVMFRP
jgi:threonine dehydrogenase-like Zn-dependent dehydrogenase